MQYNDCLVYKGHTQTLVAGDQRAKEKRDKVYIVFADDENDNSIVGNGERFIIIIIISYYTIIMYMYIWGAICLKMAPHMYYSDYNIIIYHNKYIIIIIYIYIYNNYIRCGNSGNSP